MIFQWISSLMIFAFALYAIRQLRYARMVSLVMLVTCALGAVVIWFPGLATLAASWMGIGRGVDLVLYVFLLFSLFAIFNLHLRLRANHEILTQLSREIAILSARSPG